MLLGTPPEDENGNITRHGPKPSGGAGSYKSYRSADSMVYHQSMFLKRLSNPYVNHDPKHHETWREKLGEFLEGKKVQIFMFTLIVIDLLVIVAQLFIIDPQNCAADHGLTVSSDPHHSSSSHHSESHSAEPHHNAYHLAGEILDLVSLAILCTLALETILLFIAFDIKLFKQPLYILDALVIGASLGVELESKGHDIVGSLLIFFRLWRIVRIVHGVAMSVQEKNEKVIKDLEKEAEELAKHKTDLQTKYDYLKKRYRKLVAETESNLASDSDLKSSQSSSLSSPPASFNSPFASPQAPNPVQTRVRSKALRIEDTQLSDDEKGTNNNDSVSVSVSMNLSSPINGVIPEEDEVRRPLIRGNSHQPSNGGTFKH